MTVFNYGSINIDCVYRVDHLVQPGETLSSESLETVLGGKGANQSVALARAGANVKHLGRISTSDAWAKEMLKEFGVDVSGIEFIDGASGHAIIQVDAAGENAIVLHGGANQSFDESSIGKLLQSAEAGDWLLIQNECNALEHVFAVATEKKLNIAFNPAPMHSSVTALPLERCKLLVVNEVEAQQLANTNRSNTSELFAELMAKYPESTIVVTLGSKGAALLDKQKIVEINAPSVEVVDTTGAGDTFVGFFLAGLIENLSSKDCLERACAAGALAVTVAGATPSVPTRASVDQALKNQ